MLKMGFQRKSPFYTPCPMGECNFINSFHLSSFATIALSTFIYFRAFWSSSATVFGGLLVIEKKKSPSNNLAWKVVRMTWSLAFFTCSSSLLNWVTCYLSDTPSTCWMLRRWPVGFLRLCPPMKWWTKPLLSCSKFVIVPGGILLNHTLVAPFSVIGNALHITLSGVICNGINVLNDSMWFEGSLEPSYDSDCGRRNFGERGRFSTSVVNGESVLRIIPSRFSLPLSFIALFSSSISFLMSWSLFSTLVESSPKVLSRLLAWEFDFSSFWFSPVCQCSAFWDSIVFHSSSFWRVNFSTLAKRAWICCCCITSNFYAVLASILYFEELFCHWERWLEWLAFPTDSAKLMM